MLVHPSSLALWFISAANSLWLPETFSASPFATSHAERKSIAYMASSTFMVSPAFMPAVTAPLSRLSTALELNVNVSLISSFSAARSAVSNFVVDAGDMALVLSFSKSTCLVVAS